ncbi:SDR family oxidoreductase [Pseudonocardia sp. NPDC049154]|uniref:SDR family NAD(P)-dependent oxidoreductase n=1 Tax=Pseudonocardia sp. NPDC049154 TaxID=3155501 RepID=UPI003405F631
MRLLVTGAGGGIGGAVARLATARYEGAVIALVDRDKSLLDETAQAVTAGGGRPVVVQSDLSTVEGPAEAVRAAEQELGGIDALVSNAGLGGGGPLHSLDVESWDQVFAVNTRATWLLAKAAYPALVASRGSVVATTSISARHPTPPMGAYSPSKAALLMLVKQLALEWGPDGVRVNAVAPGPTDTGLTFAAFGNAADEAAVENRRYRESLIPMRRIGHPDDVAEAVLWLSGPGAAQVTGNEITVDGGLSQALMPVTGGGSGHQRGRS